ncbi:MAG TPA: carboxymuconolactone decarboxylase family protein [Acidobacteriaceae bacterium]|nr:carboxymuconolactone decarboxylase family protein [Acidobacteriaceae bacterium]
MAATLPSEKAASERISPSAVAPEALHPLYIAGNYLRTATTLESPLRNLVYLRASQMNGCAFCIAMHWREAKEDGLSDDHLHGLLAWREAPWYTDRERAALAWTEALTDIAHSHAPDDVYDQARRQFTDRELVDLTLAITTINAWNRFMAAFRVNPETAPDVIAVLRNTPEANSSAAAR